VDGGVSLSALGSRGVDGGEGAKVANEDVGIVDEVAGGLKIKPPVVPLGLSIVDELGGCVNGFPPNKKPVVGGLGIEEVDGVDGAGAFSTDDIFSGASP